jgi:uroporphyrinogen decarboxylase
MTPRERFLTAMRNGVPDRVPVSPDTSNYIPCKLTGKPYWEIYFHNDPPLWKAYLNVTDQLGSEAWNTACWSPKLKRRDDAVGLETSLSFDAEQDAMVQHTKWILPDGELTGRQLCFRQEPPSPIEKPIKDIERDLPIWLAMLEPPDGVDEADVAAHRAACEARQQAFGVGIGYPGFHMWETVVQGGIEPLTYAMMDCPQVLDAWHEKHMAYCVQAAKVLLDLKPDYLFFGGSGTLTMASPELARRYALPTLKAVTAMARQADVPTLVHSCGRSWAFMEMLAEDTDMDMFNPVELPPHGDAELGPAREAFGQRLALMGNLHTTDVMLRGTPQQVREHCAQAMRDAGMHGGFILSTGDQCPRETPMENLHAMVEAAHSLGVYEQGRVHDTSRGFS